MVLKRRAIFIPQTTSADFIDRKRKRFAALVYRPKRVKSFVKGEIKVPVSLLPMEKADYIRQFAQKAEFRIRPFNPKIGRIKAVLETNGIRTEKMIQDLHNGTGLFQKAGFALDSPQGKKILEHKVKEVIPKIIRTIARMHSLGIVHGHPHMGNWAITKSGELILLDFRKARLLKIPRKECFLAKPAVEEMRKAVYIFDEIYKDALWAENRTDAMTIFEMQRYGKIPGPCWGFAMEEQARILKERGDVKQLMKLARIRQGRVPGFEFVRALEEIGGRRATPTLRKGLETGEFVEEGLEGLIKRGDKKAALIAEKLVLRKAAESETQGTYVPVEVFEGIMNLEGRHGTRRIARILSKTKNPWIIFEGVKAMTKSVGNAATRGALERAGFLDSTLKVLSDIIETSKRRDMLFMATDYLGRIGDSRQLALLQRATTQQIGAFAVQGQTPIRGQDIAILAKKARKAISEINTRGKK